MTKADNCHFNHLGDVPSSSAYLHLWEYGVINANTERVIMKEYSIAWEIDWPAESSIKAVQSLIADNGLLRCEALDEAVVTVKKHAFDNETYSVRLQFSQHAVNASIAIAHISTRFFRLANFLEATEFLIKEKFESKYKATEVAPEL